MVARATARRVVSRRRAPSSLATPSAAETDVLYWLAAFRSAQCREQEEARAPSHRRPTAPPSGQEECSTRESPLVSTSAASAEPKEAAVTTEAAIANSTDDNTTAITSAAATRAAQTGTTSSAHAPSSSQPVGVKSTSPVHEPTPTPPSFSTHTTTTTLLHDALPLFASIVDGSLGPVALEVIILGHVSLLSDPLLFAQTLEDHRRADSAARRRLQDSVTVFLLLSGVHLYCLDPTTYPVLPLLARLLMSSRVTLLTLHVRLLFDLMLLFLGSDRLQVGEGVVDVEVWAEVVQRGAMLRHTSHTLNSNDRNEDHEQDYSAAGLVGNKNSVRGLRACASTAVIVPRTAVELTEALSVEQQQSMSVYGETMTRWVGRLKQQQQQYVEEGVEEESTKESPHRRVVRRSSRRRVSLTRQRNSPSPHAPHQPDEYHSQHETNHFADKENVAHQTAATAMRMREADATHTAAAAAAQSHGSVASGAALALVSDATTRRRRTRSYSLPMAPAGLSESVWAVVQHFRAETLGRTLAMLASVYTFYDSALAPVLSQSRALASLCVRYTYMCVLCTVMTHHGLFVSKNRYDAMQEDLQSQIDDIATAAAAVMCTSDTYHMDSAEVNMTRNNDDNSTESRSRSSSSSTSSSSSNAYNDDSRNKACNNRNKKDAMAATRCAASHTPPALHSLSAEDVLEHLLCSLDEATRHTLLVSSESASETARRPRRPAQTQGVSFLRYCVSVLSQLFRDHDNTPNSDGAVALGSRNDSLFIPQGTSSCPHNNNIQSAHTSSAQRRALTLAILWLAAQERRDYQKSLRDFLTTGGTKLVAHVLQAPASSSTSAAAAANSSSLSCSTFALSGSSCVCFSLHSYWDIHVSTTGRIFSSGPNVQNMPHKPARGLYALAAAPHTTQSDLSSFSTNSAKRTTPADEQPHEQETNIPTTTTSTSCSCSSVSVCVPTDAASSVQASAKNGRPLTHTPARMEALCHTRPTVPLLRRYPHWTLRHLCVAPPGCVLVSLDYNQIELRVLAHMSGDAALVAHLSESATSQKDVLRHMAAAVLRLPDALAVTEAQRQAVKLLVYGLIYGMGVDRMQERIDASFGTVEAAETPSHTTTGACRGEYVHEDGRRTMLSDACHGNDDNALRGTRQAEQHGHCADMVNEKDDVTNVKESEHVSHEAVLQHGDGTSEARARATAAPPHTQPLSAGELLRAFRLAYPRVHAYLQATRQQAMQRRCVRTLSGVKDLSSQGDAARRRQNGVAHAIQGGAADILHSAMRDLHQAQHSFLPCFPVAPAALVMVVHDELIYAMPSAAVEVVVPQMVRMMQRQSELFQLRVPLRVTVRMGCSLGELQEWKCDTRRV